MRVRSTHLLSEGGGEGVVVKGPAGAGLRPAPEGVAALVGRHRGWGQNKVRNPLNAGGFRYPLDP